MSDINITVNDEIVNIDVIDEPVLVNVVNSPGQQGPAGPGVPVGGTAGQILAKASATNYDTEWINNYAKYLATNVRNQTGSTIGAFQVVYISGATGNKPLISLADADTEATSSKTYGVTATSIANNGTGDVVTAGELSGINTSAFNEGDLLWLSTTAGGVVTSPPAEPAHAVFIGYVVRSHPTLGVIDVAIANGYELNELHGVQITTPTNNQGLFYNSSNSLWENKSVATVLGYTPEQPLTFNSPLSRAGNVVSIPQATGSVNGFLSATDWTTFNSKQDALGFTPANAATTLTINGVTYDLSTSRTWNISTGISGSGASGQVTYWTGASAVSGSNNLFWDATNSRLGIGTNAPAVNLDIIGASTGSGSAYLRVQRGTNLSGDAAFVTQPQGTLSAANVSWNYGLQANSNNFRFWYYNGTTTATALNITNTGNIHIGSGTDAIVRLQVSGDTLLRGSGATSATTALRIQNSGSSSLLLMRNDGVLELGGVDAGPFMYPITTSNAVGISGTNLGFYSLTTTQATDVGTYSFNGANLAQTSGNVRNVHIYRNFQPTSGTATYSGLSIFDTINQTGGANGITRGLYVNPTLTAAADFRAIEVSAGVTVLAPSVTARASLRIPSGTAPTSPVDGDIWFDGTNIQMRIGGVTKTFTLL